MLPAFLMGARAVGGVSLRAAKMTGRALGGALRYTAPKVAHGANWAWDAAGGNRIAGVDGLFKKITGRVERIGQGGSNADKLSRVEKEKERREKAKENEQEHEEAHKRATETKQGDKTVSYLEKISNDLTEIKEKIAAQEEGKKGDGGILSGILGALGFMASASIFGAGGAAALKFSGLGGKALGALGSMGKGLWNLGKGAVTGAGRLAAGAGSALAGAGNGLFSAAGNVAANSAGKGLLSNAGGAIAKGIGSVGRLASAGLRFLGPAGWAATAGMTGYEVGGMLNKAMEGTSVGKFKDKLFDGIFSGIDKITGGMISGDAKFADDAWKTSSGKKFVDGAKNVAGAALTAAVPAAAASADTKNIPGMKATVPAAAISLAAVTKSDAIREKSERDKFQRQSLSLTEQANKLNDSLVDEMKKNTQATEKTVPPLEKISDPDWLDSVKGFVGGAVRGVRSAAEAVKDLWNESSVGKTVNEAVSAVTESAPVKAITESAPVKAVTNTVSNAIETAASWGLEDWSLGQTSKEFESGRGGAGTISSGKGDAGGKSYGTYQLTRGALKDFVRNGKYAKDFEGLELKSSEFDAKWKELAKNDPAFAKAQHDYIAATHYQPQVETLQKAGLDLSSRGPAVQDAIWSVGVQYGGETNLIKNALKGKDVSKMSDADIVTAIQDHRRDTVETRFKSSSQDTRNNIRKRAEREKSRLLALDKRWKETGSGSVETASLTPATVERASDIQAASVSNVQKLDAATPNLGEVVGRSTMEARAAEQKAAAPVVIAAGNGGGSNASAPVSGTAATAQAPMVTRNTDSSIRRVTDGMMSYGLS